MILRELRYLKDHDVRTIEINFDRVEKSKWGLVEMELKRYGYKLIKTDRGLKTYERKDS